MKMKTMKKIMMMAAIVFAAITANAGTVAYSATNIWTGNTWDRYSGLVQMYAIINGVDTLINTFNVSTAGRISAEESQVTDARLVGGNAYEFYFRLVSGNLTYASSKKNSTVSQTGVTTISFGTQKTISTSAPRSTSPTPFGVGWIIGAAQVKVYPNPGQNTTLDSVVVGGNAVAKGGTDGNGDYYLVDKNATVDVRFVANDGYVFSDSSNSKTVKITASEDVNAVAAPEVQVASKAVSVNVTSGMPYILGVKYQKEASATPGKISLNDLITLSDSITPGTFASDFANAPVVRVLKEEEQGYKHYYYISDATVKGSATAVGHNTWADMNGDEVTADDDLALGQGFVFQASQSGTLTLDGEEYTGTDLVSPKDLKAGKYYLLSNNQPKEFTFTKLASTHAPGAYDSDFAGASEIMVMRTSGGYDHYYWISDATDSDDEPLNYDTWSDADGYLLNGNQIDAAKGFWLKAPQDCSISIKQ